MAKKCHSINCVGGVTWDVEKNQVPEGDPGAGSHFASRVTAGRNQCRGTRRATWPPLPTIPLRLQSHPSLLPQPPCLPLSSPLPLFSLASSAPILPLSPPHAICPLTPPAPRPRSLSLSTPPVSLLAALHCHHGAAEVQTERPADGTRYTKACV